MYTKSTIFVQCLYTVGKLYLLQPTLCFNSSSSQKGISDNSTNIMEINEVFKLSQPIVFISIHNSTDNSKFSQFIYIMYVVENVTF